jgi:hypothetical protein
MLGGPFSQVAERLSALSVPKYSGLDRLAPRCFGLGLRFVS